MKSYHWLRGCFEAYQQRENGEDFFYIYYN